MLEIDDLECPRDARITAGNGRRACRPATPSAGRRSPAGSACSRPGVEPGGGAHAQVPSLGVTLVPAAAGVAVTLAKAREAAERVVVGHLRAEPEPRRRACERTPTVTSAGSPASCSMSAAPTISTPRRATNPCSRCPGSWAATCARAARSVRPQGCSRPAARASRRVAFQASIAVGSSTSSGVIAQDSWLHPTNRARRGRPHPSGSVPRSRSKMRLVCACAMPGMPVSRSRTKSRSACGDSAHTWMRKSLSPATW